MLRPGAAPRCAATYCALTRPYDAPLHSPTLNPCLDPRNSPAPSCPAQTPITPPHSPAPLPCTSPHCAPAPHATLLHRLAPRSCMAPRLVPVRFRPDRAAAVRLRPVASSAQPPGPPQLARRSLPGTRGLRRPNGVTAAPLRARHRPAQGRTGRQTAAPREARPTAATAPNAVATQHPRGRRDAHGPKSTPLCHHVPTPRNCGPQRGPRRPNTGERGGKGIHHT